MIIKLEYKRSTENADLSILTCVQNADLPDEHSRRQYHGRYTPCPSVVTWRGLSVNTTIYINYDTALRIIII